MLVGRSQELAFLEENYQAPGSRLLALYGRRRTGKTELLKTFCQDKDAAFYVCRETTDQDQIRLFSRKILGNTPLAPYLQCFEDWERAFTFLMEPRGPRKTVLVIDEFPYMVAGNPAIPSILQNVWDARRDQSNTLLVLSGSSVGAMERELLADDAPLYGRTDGIYLLDELGFRDSLALLGGADPWSLQAWGILGGIPRYLRGCTRDRDIRENTIGIVLAKGAPLYSEIEYLMKQDLRETSTYFAILEAMGAGCTGIGEISQKTGLDRTKVNVYLRNLIDRQVVCRIHPVAPPDARTGVRQPGRYLFTNNFFRFYFRFVLPAHSLLEENEPGRVWDERIAPHLRGFLRESFVGAAREILRAQDREGELPLRLGSLGPWWDRESGLDLLGFGAGRELLAAAVPAGPGPAGLRDLEALRETTALLRRPDYHKTYALFSQDGFSDALRTLAEADESVRLEPLV